MASRAELIQRFEHLLWAGTHGNVFGKIRPANNAIGVEKKFSRSCDVHPFRSRAGMKDVVSANNLRVRIGKQWKPVPEFSRVPLVNLGRIDADADNANATRVEFRKPVLETPQLGVTERSPKTTVENQHRAL